MRTISSNLKADIEAGTIARLLKLSCTNGTVYAFTDHDQELVVDAVTYLPTPGLTAVEFTSTADVQVSTQQTGAAMVDVPEADLLGGVFDDCQVEAAWCSWKNPSYGKVITFFGRVGEITWNETGFQAEIMSFMKQLELNIGHVYTASCRHQLFSAPTAGKIGACTLSSTSYTFTGSVDVVNIPKWKFDFLGTSQADGYFDNGLLTFTSGINSGLSVTVKKQVGNNFELVLPTAFTIVSGVTFSVQAGCDKTMATCKAKFDNVVNFGGFPHINTDINWR
jgi:uncharacterized phage protein (TIGR02218 family)